MDYKPPVEPKGEYEYRLDVPNVIGAYPSGDEEYYRDIQIRNPVDELEIEVEYRFQADLYGPKFIDLESDQDRSSPDVYTNPDRIADTVENVGPGHYRLSWEMEPLES